MIAGSSSVGFSFVYARKFIRPLRLSPLALTNYQTGFALVILLVTTNLNSITDVFHDTKASVGLVAGLGLFGTGFAYIAYYLIVDRLGAIVASGVTYIPPVVALFIGVTFVDEPVHAADLAATAAIPAGVGLLQSGRTGAAKKISQ